MFVYAPMDCAKVYHPSSIFDNNCHILDPWDFWGTQQRGHCHWNHYGGLPEYDMKCGKFPHFQKFLIHLYFSLPLLLLALRRQPLPGPTWSYLRNRFYCKVKVEAWFSCISENNVDIRIGQPPCPHIRLLFPAPSGGDCMYEARKGRGIRVTEGAGN